MTRPQLELLHSEDFLSELLSHLDIRTLGSLDTAWATRDTRSFFLKVLKGSRLQAFEDYQYTGAVGLELLSYASRRGIDLRNFKIYLPGDSGGPQWVQTRQHSALNYLNINPSPLTWVCYSGKSDVMTLMLSHRHENIKMKLNNINETDGVGYTSLHIAAITSDTKMMKLMLDEGANPNAQCLCNDRSPLHLVCCQRSNGRQDCASLLLEHGADINLRDRRGQTPLFGSVKCCELETVEFLCSHPSTRCQINVQDYVDGNTPLHCAAKRGSLTMVKLLCRFGADPTLLNRDKSSAGEVAVEQGHTALAQFMEDYVVSRKAGPLIYVQ